MGKRTPESKGCKVIRVTTSHDQTTEAGYRWLLDQVRKIPKHIPILLWGSIPCTGGTPWARYNLRRYPHTFPARLRRLRAEWRKLICNFFRLSDIIRHRNGYWALEWPSRCSYWESPQVEQFLRTQRGTTFEATATGCAFGLRAISGPLRNHPMSKAWHVKGTSPTTAEYLNRNCQCESNIKHAPTSGANTAHTGRYTSAFVTAIHRMFHEATKRRNET